VTVPPGTRGVPHVHHGHESAIHTVSSETEVWHGEGLRHRAVVTAGHFLYVPPGTPHLPVSRSEVTTVVVVAKARAAPAIHPDHVINGDHDDVP
jgi:uncharacterized RmlC-like cupin family protein